MKHLVTRFLIISILISSLLSVGVSGQSSESFTHWETTVGKVAVASYPMYQATKKITGTSLGLEDPLKGLTDIYSALDGTTYLLCGDESRIFVLNADYTLKKEMIVTTPTGEEESFSGAMGIYVDEQGLVYLSDTLNGRILILNEDGVTQDVLTLPDSELIPDEFVFQPTELIKDNAGQHYVLSLGSYYGAILYSQEKEFLGFYGSNTVQATALDALSYIWDLITSNNIKKSKTARVLPFAFNDFCFDNDGYIYTCTGATTTRAYTNGVGQIYMLSPGGSNILLKRNIDGSSTSASNVNFVEDEVNVPSGQYRLQNFVSIAINEAGYIFALDQTYGLVYVYDTDCNLITAFGGGVGKGNQLGLFNTANSLSINGSQILVTDSKLNTVTVFEITNYGGLVQQAQNLYLDGEYLESESLWQQVLSMDSNSRLWNVHRISHFIHGESCFRRAKSSDRANLRFKFQSRYSFHRHIRI